MATSASVSGARDEAGWRPERRGLSATSADMGADVGAGAGAGEGAGTSVGADTTSAAADWPLPSGRISCSSASSLSP
eukprot:1703384-Prymnesium_polylepis.1